jgi:maleylpyruvate isomerase
VTSTETTSSAGRRPDFPARWLAGCERSHRALEAAVRSLTEEEVRQPSLLPGWSRGIVITHIARNADGIRHMAGAAKDGRAEPMYPGGVEQREAGIEAGANRARAEVLADLENAQRKLESAWDAMPDEMWTEGIGYRLAGPATMSDLVFVRWREVAVHTIDLGLPGIDARSQWRALDPDYLEEEWRWSTAGLSKRVPKDHTLVLAPGNRPSRAYGSGPNVVVVRDPIPDVLAWLTGRADGALPLGPWT